jgi:hypothetical protein
VQLDNSKPASTPVPRNVLVRRLALVVITVGVLGIVGSLLWWAQIYSGMPGT